ncbi:MAG: hypothetical protein HYZ45_13935 [Burkholderiales bacterium]|nr:hypothetical protein [Burkholderiales bacterium]
MKTHSLKLEQTAMVSAKQQNNAETTKFSSANVTISGTAKYTLPYQTQTIR